MTLFQVCMLILVAVYFCIGFGLLAKFADWALDPWHSILWFAPWLFALFFWILSTLILGLAVVRGGL